MHHITPKPSAAVEDIYKYFKLKKKKYNSVTSLKYC